MSSPLPQLISICLVLGLTPLAARADIVRLKGGGTVRGQVTADDEAAPKAPVAVLTASGGTVLIDPADVASIERRPLIVEAYLTRARSLPDTVEAHANLADWCRDNRLTEQRIEQLELLLEIDPDHTESRRVLGHVRYNSQWITRDEWMTARGYVKHKGRYITQQELDLLEKSDAEREAESAWFPKVRGWFTWATGRSPQRAAEGTAQLRSIDDPDAVPALVNFLGTHDSAEVRLLCVELMGRLTGDKPVAPLVDRALFDGEHEIRIAARAGIKPEQYSLALEHLVPELKSDSNVVVKRAAVAIGDMREIAVVPFLIQALITEHKWKVTVPAGSTASFGISPSGEVNMNNAQSGAYPAEVEALARTGQLPYGAIVVPSPWTPRQTRTITIRGNVKNTEVLAALKKLTGQDFGFDARAWQVWWQTEAKS